MSDKTKDGLRIWNVDPDEAMQREWIQEHKKDPEYQKGLDRTPRERQKYICGLVGKVHARIGGVAKLLDKEEEVGPHIIIVQMLMELLQLQVEALDYLKVMDPADEELLLCTTGAMKEEIARVHGNKLVKQLDILLKSWEPEGEAS